ncbi:MAG TPA: hypothetical protein VM165_07675, partial [Planctomycetaceae bacterium]|nr:hypothetical protein [Planctomycetaceae bacterium]
AAFLSMIAYVQAFNDTKGTFEEKQADIGFIVGACNLLTDRWPDSDKANDARMTLGRIYSQLKQPVLAAEWYGKVPEADPKFPEAQLAAGQAYWTAYLNSSRPGDEEKIDAAQLTEWRKQGEQYLRSGIAKLSATAPKDSAPPELIAAKMSLAQIVISLGQDAEAIKLLLDEPQSVIKAITVADEAQRPEKGVQSRQFATETYKLLLRAYIGGGKLDDARATMRTLEKVAGGEAGADVTDLYVGLGKLLRDELDRFREAGETEKFNKLMTSFETFLNDLYQRKEGQSFGSLSWIGETYFALGEASSNDASRSANYFDKAGKAFQDILTQAEKQSDYLQPDQLAAVKVRLVRCSRLKKEFEAGEKLIVDVLKTREKDMRAQIEAAYLFQDWGSSGSAEATSKLLIAIGGNPQIKMWGWANLSNRLQNVLNQGKTEFLPTFVESRVNGTICRQRYAQAQTTVEKRLAELEKCEVELVAAVSITRGLTDEQVAELNQLYRKVLQDAGKPVTDLQPQKDMEPPTVAADENPAPKQTEKVTTGSHTPAAAAESSTMTTVLGFLVVLLAGGGIVGWMVLSKKKSQAKVSRQPATLASAPVMPFDIGLGEPAAPPPPPRPKPKAPAAPVAGTAPTKTASAKPAAKPGVAKPKPKPPEQA